MEKVFKLRVYDETDTMGCFVLKVSRHMKGEKILSQVWASYDEKMARVNRKRDPTFVIKSASGDVVGDPLQCIEGFIDGNQTLYSIRIGLLDKSVSVADGIEEMIHAPPSAAIFNQQGYPCEGKEPWEWILCEPIDDSIEAIRNRDPTDDRPKLIRAGFVVDGNRKLVAILISDLGHGMDRQEVKAWLTYAQDKDSRRAEAVQRAAEAEGEKEELGRLGRWGRGSKDAGFWWGTNIALITRPQDNGGMKQVLEVEMNVTDMTKRGRDGQDPYSHTMYYRPAGERSAKCVGLDKLRNDYPAIDAVIAQTEQCTQKLSGSFTLFVISEPTDRVPVLTDKVFSGIVRNLKQMYPLYLDRAGKDCVPESMVLMKDLDIRLAFWDDQGKTLLEDGDKNQLTDVSLRESGVPPSFLKDPDRRESYRLSGMPNLPWVDGWTRLMEYAAKRPADPSQPDGPQVLHNLRFRMQETRADGRIGTVHGFLFYLPASSEFVSRESRQFLNDYFSEDTSFLCFWHGRLMPGERFKDLPFLELTQPGNAYDPAERQSHAQRQQVLQKARRRVVGILFFNRGCPINVVKSQFDGQVRKELLKDSSREWDDPRRSFEVCSQDRAGGRWTPIGRYRFSEWLLDCTKRFDRSVKCFDRIDWKQGVGSYRSAQWGKETFRIGQWVSVRLIKDIDNLDKFTRDKQDAGVRRVVHGQIQSITVECQDPKADPYLGHTCTVRIVNTPLEMYGNPWSFAIHRIQRCDHNRSGPAPLSKCRLEVQWQETEGLRVYEPPEKETSQRSSGLSVMPARPKLSLYTADKRPVPVTLVAGTTVGLKAQVLIDDKRRTHWNQDSQQNPMATSVLKMVMTAARVDGRPMPRDKDKEAPVAPGTEGMFNFQLPSFATTGHYRATFRLAMPPRLKFLTEPHLPPATVDVHVVPSCLCTIEVLPMDPSRPLATHHRLDVPFHCRLRLSDGLNAINTRALRTTSYLRSILTVTCPRLPGGITVELVGRDQASTSTPARSVGGGGGRLIDVTADDSDVEMDGDDESLPLAVWFKVEGQAGFMEDLDSLADEETITRLGVEIELVWRVMCPCSECRGKLKRSDLSMPLTLQAGTPQTLEFVANQGMAENFIRTGEEAQAQVEASTGIENEELLGRLRVQWRDRHGIRTPLAHPKQSKVDLRLLSSATSKHPSNLDLTVRNPFLAVLEKDKKITMKQINEAKVLPAELLLTMPAHQPAHGQKKGTVQLCTQYQFKLLPGRLPKKLIWVIEGQQSITEGLVEARLGGEPPGVKILLRDEAGRDVPPPFDREKVTIQIEGSTLKLTEADLSLWKSGTMPPSRLVIGAAERSLSVEIGCKKPEWKVTGTLTLKAKAGRPVKWVLVWAGQRRRGAGLMTLENAEDVTKAFQWMLVDEQDMETGVVVDPAGVHLELDSQGALFYTPNDHLEVRSTIAAPSDKDRWHIRGPEGQHRVRVKDAAGHYTPSEWAPFDLVKGPPVDVELRDSIGAVNLGVAVSSIRLALKDVGGNECLVPKDMSVKLESGTKGLRVLTLQDAATWAMAVRDAACLTLPSFAVVEARSENADSMDLDEEYDGSEGLMLRLTLRSAANKLTLQPEPIPVTLNAATQVDHVRVYDVSDEGVSHLSQPTQPVSPHMADVDLPTRFTAGSPLLFRVAVQQADGTALDTSSPAFQSRFQISCKVRSPGGQHAHAASEEDHGVFRHDETSKVGDYTLTVSLAYRLPVDGTHLAYSVLTETVTVEAGPAAELAWLEGKRPPAPVKVNNEQQLVILQASKYLVGVRDQFGNPVSPTCPSLASCTLVARWDSRGGPTLEDGGTEVCKVLGAGVAQAGLDVAVQAGAEAVTGKYLLQLTLRNGDGVEPKRPLTVSVDYINMKSVNLEEERKVRLMGHFEDMRVVTDQELKEMEAVNAAHRALRQGFTEWICLLKEVSKYGDVPSLARMEQEVRKSMPEALDLKDWGAVLKGVRTVMREWSKNKAQRQRSARSGIPDELDKRVATKLARGLEGFLGTVAQLGWVENEDDARMLAQYAGKNMAMLIVCTHDQQNQLFQDLRRERSVLSLQNTNLYPWPSPLHHRLPCTPEDLKTLYGNPRFMVDLIQVAEPFRSVSDNVKRVFQTVWKNTLVVDSRAQGERYRLWLLGKKVRVPHIYCRDGAVFHSDGISKPPSERPDSVTIKELDKYEAYFGAPPSVAAGGEATQTLEKRITKDPTPQLVKLQEECQAALASLNELKAKKAAAKKDAEQVLKDLKDSNAASWVNVSFSTALQRYMDERNQTAPQQQQQQSARRGSPRPPNASQSAENGRVAVPVPVEEEMNGKKRRRSSAPQDAQSPGEAPGTRKARLAAT